MSGGGGGGGTATTINNTENKVGALRVQSSTQGIPIPLAYGMCRVTPNLIDYDDFTATAHVTSSTSGGGGGGGKGGGGGGGSSAVTTTTTTYTYSVALLIGLCEGPVGYFEHGEGPDVLHVFNRLWSGKDKDYVSSLFLTQFQGTWGDPGGQTAFGYMATNHPTKALGYRNTAYVASGAFPLGKNTSVPNLSFEVFGFLNPSGCTPDVNPSDVLADLLTAPNYGAGFPSARLGDLSDFALYCAASNYMCAPVYSAQRPAADIVKEICLIGNSQPVWSEGVLKIKPYGDETVSYTPNAPGNTPGFSGGYTCNLSATATWVPDLTVQYHLGYDDFIAAPGTDPVTVVRKRQSDAYNQVKVEILDRTNDYNVFVAEASDITHVELYGLRPMQTVTLHAVCNTTVGRNIAQTMLQRALYVRNEYTFQLGWKYSRLEPMDIVALTDPMHSMVDQPVRITAVEEDEDGLLTITAEDLSSGSGTPGLYDVQATGGTKTNTAVLPGDSAAPVIFQPPIELSGVPQVWIGTSGGQFWGGAEIWVSDDGVTYGVVGSVSAPAKFGVTTANVPAHTDPDTTSTISVDLTASVGALPTVSALAADAGDSLCYLGGEIISYSVATLTSAYNYNLTTYTRRGVKCSVALAHPVGTKFMRLDSAVGQFGVTSARVGQTIYVKLLSFNIYGGSKQTLDEVSAHTYVVQQLGIVAANGTIPNVITAQQVLCIQPTSQMQLAGRLTNYGRVNLDGRLIIQ